MTDARITALSRPIDPYSYTAANPAMIGPSDSETIRGQVLDTGAKDAIACIFANIEAAESRLFIVLAITLPIAVELLTFPIWS
jgi:hypothetical protein